MFRRPSTGVFEMQGSSGEFGSWGPGSGNLWLTSYVTDFLTRAKETGYSVRPIQFGQALDRLQNFVTNAQDFKSGGESHAYALYVLARNGRAPIGELRYYADTRLGRFATPLAQAQLGAALSMLGEKTRAETAFRAALAHFDGDMKQTATATWRQDYGSSLRDGAALVALTSEANVAKAEAPRLVNVIAEAYQRRTYTSTQEQAWMLLAAKALSDETKGTNLSLGGVAVQGAILRSLSAQDLTKSVVVSNDGETAVDAMVTVIGASLTPEPATSKGFIIERSYYTLDGTEVEMKSAGGGVGELAQNARLVAVVKVQSDAEHGRVLLVDRLPSGLEVENPRLVDSGDVKSLSWLSREQSPEHVEFRDDRFVAAFNIRPSRSGNNGRAQEAAVDGRSDDARADSFQAKSTVTVAYIVRAVTPGRFVHPAATVEDMYRPERHARTASGMLTITPNQ